MKIVEESDQRIVLRDSNWGGIVVGAILTFGSLYFAYRFALSSSADGNVKALIIPGIFLLIGGTLLLLSDVTIITLDKNRDAIILTKKGILGVRSKNYPKDQIARIELREQIVARSSGSNQGLTITTPQLQFQLIFVLIDGTEVALDRPQSPTISTFGVIMGGMAVEKSTGQKIATFLNIPYQEISSTGSNQGISPSGPLA